MRNNFSIRFRQEFVPFVFQAGFQFQIVGNNTVMDDADFTFAVAMRVRIYAVGGSVGSPPGMTNSYVGIADRLDAVKCTHPDCILVDFDFRVSQCYSTGIISPVFKFLQTFYQNGLGRPFSGIPYNPAHT